MPKYADRKVCWKDFPEITKDFEKQKQKWIYRGHIPGKTLMSSLERAVLYYPYELRTKSKAEKLLLREFKRRYHQYSSDVPKENDYLEWFSIMQHYGAPTRLLDFTYSIYIAAYFALEHTDFEPKAAIQQFEVFAVNTEWAIEESISQFHNSKKARNFFWKRINNTDEDLRNFRNYFMNNSPKGFVLPFNPFRLTERLSLQKGVFMCPGNINKTFEKNLKSLKGWNNKNNIVRLTLHFNRAEIIDVRSYLYDLNITRATLFPGLEGFAKSLAVYPFKLLGRDSAL
ncbi:MAG: FRG domain-containing protein [Candidatus Omnitrophota bacterium]